VANMLDDLLGQLGDSGGLDKIAANLGVDSATAKKGLGAATTAAIGAMAAKAQKPGGADELFKSLQDADDSVLDDVSKVDPVKGQEMVDGLFGDKKGEVTQQLAGSSGLNLGAITKLLPILLPILMGFLSKRVKSSGMDSADFAKLLCDAS
jgi:hypothetical protein